MNVTTEFHYCSVVSRNYGGKTREIIIIIHVPGNNAWQERGSADWRVGQILLDSCYGGVMLWNLIKVH